VWCVACARRHIICGIYYYIEREKRDKNHHNWFPDLRMQTFFQSRVNAGMKVQTRDCLLRRPTHTHSCSCMSPRPMVHSSLLDAVQLAARANCMPSHVPKPLRHHAMYICTMYHRRRARRCTSGPRSGPRSILAPEACLICACGRDYSFWKVPRGAQGIRVRGFLHCIR